MTDNFQYEVNGNGLQTLEPIVTNETHTEFYNAKGGSSTVGCGDCEFGQNDEVRLMVHQISGTGSFALVYCADRAADGEDFNNKIGFRVDWDEPLLNNNAYILQDGLPSGEGDEYGSNYMGHQWGDGCADGAVIDVGFFSDVTFTGDPTYDRSGSAGEPDDFGVVVDSSPNYVSAGKSGDVRITVPDSVTPSTGGDVAREGTEVVMVREDLAHL